MDGAGISLFQKLRTLRRCDTPSLATRLAPSKTKKPKNTSTGVIRSKTTAINDIEIGVAASFNGNQRVCAAYAYKIPLDCDNLAHDDKMSYSIKFSSRDCEGEQVGSL